MPTSASTSRSGRTEARDVAQTAAVSVDASVILRRIWRNVGACWRSFNAGGPEWIVVLAIAGILLVTGDGVCSWLLASFAPALESRFNALEKGRRILLAGVPSA